MFLFTLFWGCGETIKTADYSGYCQEDPEANLIEEDVDCDGILTADDCDDSDESSTAIADDGDCDGAITADDCDDTDASSTIVAEDGDCDGVLTAEDCDDLNETLLAVANDGDCDGILTADDCDDSDSSSTAIAEDMDCDGFVTEVDCNDTDATINPLAVDDWYDGIDSDCAGNNDYDQDEDGDAREGDEYCTVVGFLNESDCTGAGGTWSMGYDCQDTNPNRRSLANEAEPTECYKDVDGDGYGDNSLGPNQSAFGLTAGSDCNDTSITTFPGAGFNEDSPVNEYCLNDSDGDGYAAPADGECFDFTFSANSFLSGSISYWPPGKQINVLVNGDLYASKSNAGSVCIQEGDSFSFEYITSNIFSGNNHAATIEWTRPYTSSLCFPCYTDFLLDMFTISSGMVFNILETDYENGFEVESTYSGQSIVMNSSYTMYEDVAVGGEQILGTDSDDADASVH